MTLPTDLLKTTHTVGTEGGGVPASAAVLDNSIYRDPRWCWRCAGPQTFVECYEIAGVGRVGVCLGCGEEKVIPFSRATGEAA